MHTRLGKQLTRVVFSITKPISRKMLKSSVGLRIIKELGASFSLLKVTHLVM